MNEEEEIKKRYERRKKLPEKTLYSYFNKGNLFIVQERGRKMLSLLKKYGYEFLENKKIIDVGCGNGSWLRDFVQWGARPENLSGVDLLEERIKEARQLNPNIGYECANVEKLSFPDNKFDMVVISMCLSSIFDKKMKKNIAREALRVLKDDGLILWHDFRFDNPWNPDVKGIEKKEVKELFGNCKYDFNLVTLAPPIVRFFAPISWLACELLVMIPFLKTHYMVIIRKK